MFSSRRRARRKASRPRPKRPPRGAKKSSAPVTRSPFTATILSPACTPASPAGQHAPPSEAISASADTTTPSHRSDIATASPTGTSASPGSAASAALVSASSAASRANTCFIFLIGLPPLSFPCFCMFRAASSFFAAAYSVCLSRRKRTAKNLSSVSIDCFTFSVFYYGILPFFLSCLPKFFHREEMSCRF